MKHSVEVLMIVANCLYISMSKLVLR